LWFINTIAKYTGVTYISGNIIGTSFVTDKIYVHDGETSTISSSFNTPSTGCFGLACNGNNLVSVDTNEGKFYIHDGVSSTILFSSNLTYSGVSGVAVHNGNLYTCSHITNLIYKHIRLTPTINKQIAAPGPNI